MKKPIWFKRKTYGWGWYPATWQGILVTFIFLGLIVLNGLRYNRAYYAEGQFLLSFIPETLVLVLVLVAICYLTGEKPRWQWGKRKEK